MNLLLIMVINEGDELLAGVSASANRENRDRSSRGLTGIWITVMKRLNIQVHN